MHLYLEEMDEAFFYVNEGLFVDPEHEGIDTNGDGKLEIYYGEDGEALADFDGDGRYELAGAVGSSDMD